MSEKNLPIMKPGTSQKFKTGSWRFQKPKINEKECISCGICVKNCPEKSLSLDKKENKIKYNPEFCKGCGICAAECPKEAIKMIQE